MSVPSSEITFALTTGVDYRDQTEMLLASIRKHMPESNIVLFVPEESYEQFTQNYRISLEQRTDLKHGEIPRQDYPLTALTKAFVIAAEEYDTEYIVQLDSDTLLLNKFELPESPERRLFAKPTNLGSHYWASPESADQWKEIYSYFGADIPSQRVRGTFDGVEGFPVWNGGVLATTDDEFPRRWLETTKKILDSGILEDDRFYAEQISLSVLGTTEYDIHDLSVKHNYAQEYVFIPSDVQVLHYGDQDFLPFFFATPRNYSEIKGYWSGRNIRFFSGGTRRVLNVIRGRSRRHFSRQKRVWFEDLGARTIKLFPNFIEEKIKYLYG